MRRSPAILSSCTTHGHDSWRKHAPTAIYPYPFRAFHSYWIGVAPTRHRRSTFGQSKLTTRRFPGFHPHGGQSTCEGVPSKEVARQKATRRTHSATAER